ncbi:MAG: GNAT family N-acetyltransferase [Nitrospirota bacterium]|nr:GNAT family N-acetyltransferase [Nitrospirota bacterium]
MIEVIEVKTKKDLGDFIALPFSLYLRDPLFVPPLIKDMFENFSDKNPFFLHATAKYFIAKKDGKPSGRIISIVNKQHVELHKEKVGFFGFFESINDYSVASALLDKASEILKNEGMDSLRGPMNFSTNEECGFLIEGFHDPPFLMTPYNPPYYNELMERYGMKKIKDLYAYIVDVPEELPEKMLRVAEIAEKRGMRARQVNIKQFESEMQIFRNVYNSAWKDNWGFIPITKEETAYIANKLKSIVVPELIFIAEKEGEPVGFMGMLPDFNFVLKHMKGKLNLISIAKALYYSKKIKDLRMMLLGIDEKYRNKGVDALLLSEGFKGVKKGKYRRVEFSWILEDNIPVQRLIEMIGGRLYKKYRIYEKRL